MERAPFSSVDELLAAMAGLDGLPTEDVVAALPHLLQTGELLASSAPDDPELIAAGLVHDLASALGLGWADHAQEGARLVRPLLGDRVAELVAGHAEAKRYLVTVDPGYGAGLSPNSTMTLVGQGGDMDDRERDAFAMRSEAGALVALRRADDRAKDPEATTRAPEAWRALFEQVALSSR